MRILIAAIFGLALVTPASGQDESPVSVFLNAADENDFDTMRSVMAPNALERGRGEISLNRFFDKIEDCYLRRAYSTPYEGRLMFAWMCAEGDDRSRVVMGDVWLTEEGVQVGISMEQSNRRPAPPRTGSALAEEAD